MTKDEAIQNALELLQEHGVPAVIWLRGDLENLVSDFVANEEDYEKVIDRVEQSYEWRVGLPTQAVENGWDLIVDAIVEAVSDLKVEGL